MSGDSQARSLGKSKLRSTQMFQALKQTVSDFLDDNCTTLGAALAYYTIFALPPLLLVIIGIMGFVVGHEAAQARIQGQIQALIGASAGNQVGTIVAKAGQHSNSGIIGAIVGLIALLFGATSAFVQLQTSLNVIWRVKPDPKQGGVKNFITERLLSFGMVVSLGFLLLVSLAVSAALEGMGSVITSHLPQWLSKGVLHGFELVASVILIALLIAAIFKVLPDAEIKWRQVWLGAIGTALLFTAGKFLIGLYLGRSGAASVYGAAGSLILIVLWIYYSSLIVLFGAEFTKVLSERRGQVALPKEGAVRNEPSIVSEDHESSVNQEPGATPQPVARS